jgi:hypothetical protein
MSYRGFSLATGRKALPLPGWRRTHLDLSVWMSLRKAMSSAFHFVNRRSRVSERKGSTKVLEVLAQ